MGLEPTTSRLHAEYTYVYKYIYIYMCVGFCDSIDIYSMV